MAVEKQRVISTWTKYCVKAASKAWRENECLFYLLRQSHNFGIGLMNSLPFWAFLCPTGCWGFCPDVLSVPSLCMLFNSAPLSLHFEAHCSCVFVLNSVANLQPLNHWRIVTARSVSTRPAATFTAMWRNMGSCWGSTLTIRLYAECPWSLNALAVAVKQVSPVSLFYANFVVLQGRQMEHSITSQHVVHVLWFSHYVRLLQ